MLTPSLISLLGLCSLSAAWVGPANTTKLHATDWLKGSINPFTPCNVLAPSFVQASVSPKTPSGSNQALKVYFDETDFDGTRNDKGAEFCLFEPGTTTNQVNMHKAGWQGFAVYVPSKDYPSDKETGIAQQFCPGGCSSWCGIISIVNNTLALDHRPACGAATHTTIVDDIQRDVWHTMVIHFVASHNGTGEYSLWYDTELVYSKTSINLGFGSSWTNDEVDSGFFFKNGMYAYGKCYSTLMQSLDIQSC
jgi:hypothetical protein